MSYEEGKGYKYVVFWFDDESDKGVVNKAVIHLNYKLKKFKTINYPVTLGKVSRSEKEKSKNVLCMAEEIASSITKAEWGYPQVPWR